VKVWQQVQELQREGQQMLPASACLQTVQQAKRESLLRKKAVPVGQEYAAAAPENSEIDGRLPEPHQHLEVHLRDFSFPVRKGI
jgi:hypothetical protein